MKRFLISTTDELHKALQEHAKSQGQTLSGMIRQILWDWVEKQN